MTAAAEANIGIPCDRPQRFAAATAIPAAKNGSEMWGIDPGKTKQSRPVT